MKINVLNVTLKSKNGFHIGNRVNISQPYESIDYIPAASIRGALGKYYIQFYCKNPNFSLCTRGKTCSMCNFPNLFLNTQFGDGLYFSSIIINNFKKMNIAKSEIDIDTGVNSYGKLFTYTKICPLESLSLKIYLFGNYADEILRIRDLFKNFHLRIGQKKTIGWGELEMTEFRTQELNINKILDNILEKEELIIRTLTPIPIFEDNLNKNFIRIFMEIGSFFNLEIRDKNQELNVSPQKLEMKKIFTTEKPGSLDFSSKSAINGELIFKNLNLFLLKSLILSSFFSIAPSNTIWNRITANSIIIEGET